MEIRFTEDYGNFNWAEPSEFSTKWYVTIYNEENEPEKIDEVICQLSWDEDGDVRGRFEMDDGIEYLTEQSWKFATKTWSTKDYKKQTLNFIKVYNENVEEIVSTFEEKRKANLQKEIERLQKNIESTILEPEQINVEEIVGKEIQKLEGWITKSYEKLTELKEGGKLHQEETERIEKYRQEIETLKALYN